MATLSQSNFDNIINYFTSLGSSTDDYFPPSGFYFQVEIDGVSSEQARFQEVSGLDVELTIDRIKQAGENLYDFPLPGRTKFNNLILKRGLMVDNSELADWVIGTVLEEKSYPIVTKNITVNLMDPKTRNSLMSWNFNRAYPIKWSASPLKSQDSAVVVETLEFAYFNWTFKNL